MIQKLLAYQTADKKLREIEKTLSSSEDRKKMLAAKKYIDSVVENVNKLDDKAEKLELAYQQATNEQLKLQEQQAELVRALDESEDENAVSFLMKKVDELIAKIKALGEKATAIEEEIKAVVSEYNGIKAKTKAAQEQYQKNGAQYNELKKSLKADKESVDKELASLQKEVEPSLMEKYLVKRNVGKMYPVLYELRGNLCSACNMELPAAELTKLKKGEVVECGNCGRIIYQKTW